MVYGRVRVQPSHLKASLKYNFRLEAGQRILVVLRKQDHLVRFSVDRPSPSILLREA